MELVQRVNWNEYLAMLGQGSPSVGLQLVLVNILLVLFFLGRRMSKSKGKASSRGGWVMPVLFIAGNVGVVTLGDRLSF